MKKIYKLIVRMALVASVTITGFAEQQARGQAYLDPGERSFARLEITKPFIGSDDFLQVGAFSGAAFLTAAPRLNDNLHAVIELPFALSSMSWSWDASTREKETSQSFGNPYIGIAGGTRGERSRSTFEAGVRLPVIGASYSDARGMGWMADLIDRSEAFMPKLATLRLAGQYQYQVEELLVGGRIEPIIWVPTDGNAFADPFELWTNYSMFAGYSGPLVGAIAGLSGKAIITEPGGSLGDRTVHVLNFNVFSNVGNGIGRSGPVRVQPGVRVQVPLDTFIDYNVAVSGQLKVVF